MAEADGLEDGRTEEEGVSSTIVRLEAYIVCLKIAQVSDDSNPDQER